MRARFFGALVTFTLLCGIAMAQGKAAVGTDQALKDIEMKWAAAYLKGDAATIGDILADDFVGVSLEGKVQSRADVMAEAKRSKVTRSTASEIRVRILGPDAALVSGVWSGAGTDPAGHKFDIVDRWTDIFVRQGGKWKCVAQQSTIIQK
jgi:uncharacterized protein (TIGR02246 family)